MSIKSWSEILGRLRWRCYVWVFLGRAPSLYTALGKLGYKSYHYMEIFSLNGRGFKAIWCWEEAMRAKVLGEGKPYGKEEFDKVFGSYSAVTDVPNACFADELIAAYPNAKVVLGVRDPDKWMVSVENSFYEILGWSSYRFITTWIDPVLRAERAVLELVLAQLTDGDIYNREKVREGFLRHNQHFRDIVSKEICYNSKLGVDGSHYVLFSKGLCWMSHIRESTRFQQLLTYIKT
ncbi:hypothetical protein BDZ45DRAFT_751070 [Acephala macrosclerotiorum]|nr:hypothetical protein BDZ45DRAFT_751070 [Acephala macrosclerotiorum]